MSSYYCRKPSNRQINDDNSDDVSDRSISSDFSDRKTPQLSPRRRTGSGVYAGLLNWKSILIFLFLFVFIVILGVRIGGGFKGSQKRVENSKVYIFFDSLQQTIVRRNWIYYRGRIDAEAPQPRCCVGQECVENDQGRYAVVTMLRTPRYLTLVEELHCSLQRTNPELPLIIIALKHELNQQVINRIKNLNNTELRFVQNIEYSNTMYDGRYSKNWIKLRAWEFDEFDAIIVLDSDMTILSDLNSLFNLPTDIAMVPDMDKTELGYHSLGKIQGGMIFLRPCPQITQHMIQLLNNDPILQFQNEHAEQDFLDWYFKYTRWQLPIEYNYIAHLLVGGEMLGGGQPKILHFTRDKPFVYNPNAHGHQFLCNVHNLNVST